MKYTERRPAGITVYCAGNYGESRPRYKQDYDSFFKHLNEGIIEDAHRLGNANPLAFSSAGLLDSNSSSTEINTCIEKQSGSINSYVVTNEL